MPDSLQELSVRAPTGEGTRVADEVTASPDGFSPKTHRLVLLVHGYNNTHQAANESYASFCAQLAALGVRRVSLLGEICAVHWPGNRRLGALSFASYPTEIKPATRSAEVLAAFLNGLRGPQGSPLDVVLICHSLGNRVGLELLRARIAAGDPMVAIVGLCLMAAAVPVGHVDDGRLAAAARSTRTRALFSRGDKVCGSRFLSGRPWPPTDSSRRRSDASAVPSRRGSTSPICRPTTTATTGAEAPRTNPTGGRCGRRPRFSAHRSRAILPNIAWSRTTSRRRPLSRRAQSPIARSLRARSELRAILGVAPVCSLVSQPGRKETP